MEPAAVAFDDGAADRQADAHARALGGVEGLEQALGFLHVDPGRLSRTQGVTRPSPLWPVPTHSLRGWPAMPARASDTLSIRLTTTCCSCTRVPLTVGRPSANAGTTVTPLRCSSPSSIATTSRAA